MSEFRSMTITFAKDVSENGGRFHEITVDTDHADRLEYVMAALEGANWVVVSVLIDGYDFSEEMWSKHIGHASNIVPLFNALCVDPYQADTICAFITVRDCADVEKWQESIYLSGTDHEWVVREWTDNFYGVYQEVSKAYHEEYARVDPFPSWMSVDWEDTLNRLAREESSDVVEFNGMIYYFG